MTILVMVAVTLARSCSSVLCRFWALCGEQQACSSLISYIANLTESYHLITIGRGE